MIFKVILIVSLFSTIGMPKPRYVDLDEEEQQLYRAAYEPSYDEDDQEDNEIMQFGKLDLLKDGLWALKSKMKQLKAFNKALAANLLTTKLKLKELIESKKAIKAHYHELPEKKKPLHNYQPQYDEYAFLEQIPQYGPPIFYEG